jgi:hypothetical protein
MYFKDIRILLVNIFIITFVRTYERVNIVSYSKVLWDKCILG